MRRIVLTVTALLVTTACAQRVPVGEVLGPVPVTTVTDGDTLVVSSNVGPRTVRLIGIDAPEPGQTTSVGTAFAARATAYLAALLPAGTPVWLELDEGITDTYGRLLAYVYVEDAAGDWLVAGLHMRQVNLALAQAGLASVMTMPPNTSYEHLYEDAVTRARDAGVGMWEAGAGSDAAPLVSAAPALPLAIRCALYDPATPNDADGEWVSVLVSEPFDTTGYYLYDSGSKTVFPLPAGVQEPGELRIHNPDQGVWNNGGDVVYLMRDGVIIDAWDYHGQLAPQGRVVCRP